MASPNLPSRTCTAKCLTQCPPRGLGSFRFPRPDRRQQSRARIARQKLNIQSGLRISPEIRRHNASMQLRLTHQFVALCLKPPGYKAGIRLSRYKFGKERKNFGEKRKRPIGDLGLELLGVQNFVGRWDSSNWGCEFCGFVFFAIGVPWIWWVAKTMWDREFVDCSVFLGFLCSYLLEGQFLGFLRFSVEWAGPWWISTILVEGPGFWLTGWMLMRIRLLAGGMNFNPIRGFDGTILRQSRVRWISVLLGCGWWSEMTGVGESIGIPTTQS